MGYYVALNASIDYISIFFYHNLSDSICKAIINIEKGRFEAISVHTSRKEWNQRVSEKKTFPSFPLLKNQNFTKHLVHVQSFSLQIPTYIIYQPRFLFFFGAFSSGEFITSASSAASKAALAGFGLSQPDWPEAPFRTSSSMVLISSTPSGLDIVWFTRPRPKSERKQQKYYTKGLHVVLSQNVA